METNYRDTPKSFLRIWVEHIAAFISLILFIYLEMQLIQKSMFWMVILTWIIGLVVIIELVYYYWSPPVLVAKEEYKPQTYQYKKLIEKEDLPKIKKGD